MFLLTKDRPKNSVDEWEDCFRRYQDYLERNRDKFPESAYAFAVADWHYDFSDHKCPHDAWVERIDVIENAAGERNEVRNLEIKIRLLGAYHDGRIYVTYRGVTKYKIEVDRKLHGDWLYDEIRLVDAGELLHEIEFSHGRVAIVCADISYEWKINN